MHPIDTIQFQMENQAFEGEQLRKEALRDPDGHVYEDIGVGCELVLPPGCFHAVEFQRNFTLPFRHESTKELEYSCSQQSCSLQERKSENLWDEETTRTGKRRRKKDCKHCKSKLTSIANLLNEKRDENGKEERDVKTEEKKTVLPTESNGLFLPLYRVATDRDANNEPEYVNYVTTAVDTKLARVGETNEDKAFIIPERNRLGMRVNSIYSEDHWSAKEAPIFYTNLKEHGAFQRAYSLPLRIQSPSSQNRVNLRRSVRGEPPPHPARLHKHRGGWTLHLAKPLNGSTYTKSLVLISIFVLLLLGVGILALYVVLEPQKLQIVQLYLKLADGNSSTEFLQDSTTSTIVNSSALLAESTNGQEMLVNSSTTEIRNVSNSGVQVETVANSTRYCDDCLEGEVCVALVDEELPICRKALDPEDPTGCAGFCLISKQKCHRLDVDAFRCVEVEHYCLEDEWTCANTLCIPMTKRCDGHMNCYDHSDEYNCVCDSQTHFQCSNETSCLPLERKCDSKIDCWDATDEINCTLGRNLGSPCPLDNEFTCNSGQCILKTRFCDGFVDCNDKSDEPHGCEGRCNKHEFTCQNSRCITKGAKCNGVDDCGDGSDEQHCREYLTT